jgi:hypothetical protein
MNALITQHQARYPQDQDHGRGHRYKGIEGEARGEEQNVLFAGSLG